MSSQPKQQTAAPMTPPEIDRAAQWLRKRADALFVLVITSDRVILAEDSRISPRDVEETLRNELPVIARFLKEKRAKKGQP